MAGQVLGQPWSAQAGILVRRPDVVVTLAVGLVLAGLLARGMARRLGVPPLVAAAALASAALILSVTLVPHGGYAEMWDPGSAWRWHEAVHWWRRGWSELAGDVTSGFDGPWNVVLYVPAGATWTLATRRPVAVVAALALASFVIETAQGVTGLRDVSLSDFVANTIGAALGAVVARALSPAGGARPEEGAAEITPGSAPGRCRP